MAAHISSPKWPTKARVGDQTSKSKMADNNWVLWWWLIQDGSGRWWTMMTLQILGSFWPCQQPRGRRSTRACVPWWSVRRGSATLGWWWRRWRCGYVAVIWNHTKCKSIKAVSKCNRQISNWAGDNKAVSQNTAVKYSCITKHSSQTKLNHKTQQSNKAISQNTAVK